ncbi:MAG: hypothetical protein U9P63_02170 [Patescibacteria group bacterium]|nr:hypothetical protein [Patescibacteria group bacterium]
MRLFFNELQKKDFNKILSKCKGNNQTFPPYGGLINFLSMTQNKNLDLLNQEHIDLINKYKQKDIPF